MNAVNTHGLFNLNDFLPKKPGEIEVKVMQEMFEASVDGEAYDADRWSNYFRPAGMQARTGDPNVAAVASAAPVATPTPAPAPAASVAETATDTGWKETAPAAPAAEAPAGDANDILAMIRARQSQ
jgi:hypothetical protein